MESPDQPSITPQDVEPLLRTHQGNEMLVSGLLQEADHNFLRVFARYVAYSTAFAPRILRLAEAVSCRSDLFSDTHQEVRHTARRSFAVSAPIFFSAIDEFADRNAPGGPNHQELADHLLLAMGRYYHVGVMGFEQLATIAATAQYAIARFDRGYNISADASAQAVFCGLGVHLASELVAQGEFEAIDECLGAHRPVLRQWLQTREACQPEREHLPPPYYWISVHCTVEVEHSFAAFTAVNLAMHYYVGKESPEEIRQWILAGVSVFLCLHTQFMGEIGNL